MKYVTYKNEAFATNSQAYQLYSLMQASKNDPNSKKLYAKKLDEHLKAVNKAKQLLES